MGATEPDHAIAIIGMGCRFPGAADSPAAFWDLLARGGDAIVEVPRDRWDVDRFYDPDPAKPGKMYVRAGGFLREWVDQFDALFFGMSPREAALLDPQQRFLLEVAWEALEDAGLVPEALAGSDTGVYVGAFMLDNFVTQLSPLNRERIGTHSAVGSTMSLLSNRLSYVFDLRGPSVSVDTACSSSLVAFHQACQAIRHGECSLALAGGVNIMHRPEIPIAMCKGGFLSPDGRCKSFDARADGYGRGEGAGVVVLKPLAAALRDGDSIYALVRGTGVNQDGRTDGITVPNPASQAALIRTVCARAEVPPRSIRYVEAHGTGTAVGDPVETAALGEVIGRGRLPDEACVVGSVKANIGHLEAASGIAGVIKSALCLKHRQIPPLANLQTPNPKIPFRELGLRLPTRLEPMPANAGPAYVGINSFGYGGTNAHAILQEAVLPDPADFTDQDPSADSLCFLPLSARSAAALKALAKAYDRRLGDADAPRLRDLCYSAAVRRGHHDHRLAVVADSAEDMRRQLQTFVAHGPAKGMALGSGGAKGQKPVFVFTGMGPQWWAMGRELLESEPVFRRVAQQCDEIFRGLAGWSVLTEMLADEGSSRIGETQIAQPAILIVQVGLAALWRAWGIEPAAVVGHSVGEVAAACVAGVLSLEETVRVSYERSRIQQKAAGLGTMLAVALPAEAAAPLLTEHDGRVTLAAANSPGAIALAGDAESLGGIAARLLEQGVFHRFLQVEVAFHSPYMDPLLPELSECLRDLTLHAPVLPVYSTVTGARADARTFDGRYWCRNVREPVYFATAMDSLIADGYRTFLEIGPHPVLSTSIKQCLAESRVQGTVLTSLRRDQPERRTLLEALGGLYASGSPIDWSRLHERGGRYVRLPSYPWQRETYWHESDEGHLDRLGTVEHALLGGRVAAPGAAWQSVLTSSLLPWLGDHRIEDLLVLPGAAYVELGLAIQHALSGQAQGALEDLEFSNALVLEENNEPRLHITYDEDARAYAVYSQQGQQTAWSLHARGTLAEPRMDTAACPSLSDLQARCTETIDGEAHYADMRKRGLQYGPCFQGVQSVWRYPGGGEALARIQAHERVAAAVHRNRFHPTVLDACFQLVLAAVRNEDVYVPVRIKHVRLRRTPPEQFWCHCRLTRDTPDLLEGNLTLFDDEGNVLAELGDVCAKRVSKKSSEAVEDLDQWLYDFVWQKTAIAVAPGNAGRWLVFADGNELGETVARSLEEAGAAVLRVRRGSRFEEGSSSYHVRPDSKSDLHRLLDAAAAASSDHVAYLWGLPGGDSDDPVGAGSVVSALHLVQALVERPDAGRPRLVVVTRQAQPGGPGNADTELDQAPLVGLMRVVSQEHPELGSRVFDIDESSETLSLLVQEALSDSGEEEVVLRRSDRYVHRLVRRSAADLDAAVSTAPFDTDPATAPETTLFKADATYLITGGCGGFGLETATWMAGEGARHLVLVGRRGADTPGAREAVQKLEAAGAQVRLVAADVSEDIQVRDLIQQIAASMPPLRGVFHAAAVLDDGPISQLTAERFQRVMKPKAAGAWNLHCHTRDLPLDYFVLFSSVASLVGNPGQASYVAANTFLDALAHHRRNAGLPATSINWGALAQVGMVARDRGVEEHLKRVGLRSFTPSQAMGVLGRILRWNPVELGVAIADWRRWSDVNPAWAASPRYSGLLSTAAAHDTREKNEVRWRLRQMPPADRPAAISSLLIELLAATLGLPVAYIDDSLSILSMGVDSLMAMELQTAIDKRVGVKLSTLELMKGKNITQLAQEIAARIDAPRSDEEPPRPAVRPEDVLSAEVSEIGARLDELSDEQVEEMLARLQAESQA